MAVVDKQGRWESRTVLYLSVIRGKRMDTQNATLDSVEPYSIPPVETLYSRERNGKLYMKHLNAISGWTESRIDSIQ